MDTANPRSLRVQVEILFQRNRMGLTADEVAALLVQSVLAVRPRVAELRKEGFIRDTGLRRSNASGKRAIVWAEAE